MRLLTSAQIRLIERQHPGESLMLRAAQASADCATTLMQGGGRVIVLAGPGNNGGDAWLTAELLRANWHAVTVIETAEPKAAEAAAARRRFLSSGGRIATDWPDTPHDLIIDGLLGIGLSRAPDGRIADLIHRANNCGIPILALDVPSGLNADTGRCPGPCIQADRTLTFIAGKPGLFTGSGPDQAGEVHLAHLGLAEDAVSPANVEEPGTLLDLDSLRGLLPARKRDSHKGTHGSVGLLGGATGMAGALILAARAALQLGAGKVFQASLCEYSQGVDALHPEIMPRKPRELLALDGMVWVVGPGMGAADAARNLLAEALKTDGPMVLDADALNLIAKGRALQGAVSRRTTPTILTPHPAEAARLLGVDTNAINEDRVQAAVKLARHFRAHVVLKGAGTIVVDPAGTWSINPTGNPGMAAAGMGDVLSGMIGALLAQGMAPADAAKLGVCLHGAAADSAVRQGKGPIGLTASEVALLARELLNS